MRGQYRRIVYTLLLVSLLAGIASAEYVIPNFTVVYSGSTTIKDALATKSTDTERAAYLSGLAGEKLKPMKFPYFIADDKLTASKTVIAINGYRCNNGTPPMGEPANMCGYWIAATKDKKVVATNSPVWIYPAPYQYVVSETKDVAGNVTITMAEDPQTAFEQVIIEYIRLSPIGTAKTGTPL